jgi:hypothetical protein
MTNGRTFLGFLAVVCSMWCIGIALAFADEHRGESADNLLTNPGFEEMDQNVPVPWISRSCMFYVVYRHCVGVCR